MMPINRSKLNETLWDIWDLLPQNITHNKTHNTNHDLPRPSKIPNRSHNMTNATHWGRRSLGEDKSSAVKAWVQKKEKEAKLFAALHPHLAKALGIKASEKKP